MCNLLNAGAPALSLLTGSLSCVAFSRAENTPRGLALGVSAPERIATSHPFCHSAGSSVFNLDRLFRILNSSRDVEAAPRGFQLELPWTPPPD